MESISQPRESLSPHAPRLLSFRIDPELIGTVIGNPITFPFIWGLIYKVGTYVTNIKLEKITHEINFDMIVNQTYEIFFPMLVGGIITAPFVWIISYYVIYSSIASFKKRRNKKNKRVL